VGVLDIAVVVCVCVCVRWDPGGGPDRSGPRLATRPPRGLPGAAAPAPCWPRGVLHSFYIAFTTKNGKHM
jgi:hypothetical protein